ncbi:MAG: glycosyl transferase [Clostridia bacterium]|nr:glycosyl transferase [Clostridia bacterium]
MKFVRRLLLFILVIIVLVSSFIIFNGYNMYKNAISEVSLDKKVSNIRNDVNFVKIEDVPKYYGEAIIAVEDHRFKEHGAIDIISIGRALVSNIQAKELNEGGSTITQQVAKNLYFITEKNFVYRKIAEIFLAFDLENNYSKDEILELYFNTIYFGEGYYGVREASKGYYKKEPKDLSLYEASMLAGIPNAPSVYAPTVNPDLAKSRQGKVIRSMVEYGYLSQEEADKLEE